MIKFLDLLLEKKFNTYSTLVLIEYSNDSFVTNILDEVRAVTRVVVVNNETPNDFYENKAIIRVRIISTKSPKEAFELVKKDALATISDLKAFKYNPEKIRQID